MERDGWRITGVVPIGERILEAIVVDQCQNAGQIAGCVQSLPRWLTSEREFYLATIQASSLPHSFSSPQTADWATMAEDLSSSLSESFHSLSHSSTSFRLADSAVELPSRSRTSSAPITGGSNDWDSLGSSSAYGHTRDDSFGRGSTYDSPNRASSHASNSTTLRPMTPVRTKTSVEKDHLAAPAASTSKYVPKPKSAPRVLKTEVWRDLLLMSDGRDKAFVSGSHNSMNATEA